MRIFEDEKMSDKPDPKDTGKDSGTADLTRFREGVVTVVNKETTVQRLDPGPKKPAQRTPVENSVPDSAKK